MNKAHKFLSPFAQHFNEFIALKHACGYSYNSPIGRLKNFDRFLFEHNSSAMDISQELIEEYLKKQPHESYKTQKMRISTVKQFTEYLSINEVKTYTPTQYQIPRGSNNFIPYIFSNEEIVSLFKAADDLSKEKKYQGPLTKMMPIILRLLYSSGLRLNEALLLKWHHVDWGIGAIRVIDAKFSKERLLPLSKSMLNYLESYAQTCSYYDNNAYVFPNKNKNSYKHQYVYLIYRKILHLAGIAHRGRGFGPRIHDLRHTYAVHNFKLWLENNEGITHNVRVLSDYLGHETLEGTQVYLRLLPSFYPLINRNMENFIGDKLLEVFNEE